MTALPTGTILIRTHDHRIVFRAHRRSMVVTATLTVLTTAVALWSLTVGHFPLTAADVMRVLTGGGTVIENNVLFSDRMPRVTVALLTGAAFALSGAILQRIASNPLVSPDVIGINAGAAFGALIVITVIGGAGLSIVAGALTGALLTIGLILAIANKNGLTGYRLVLVGIGVTAMLSSMIALVLTRANIYQAHTAAMWLTGSLANRAWTHALIIGVACGVLVPALLLLSRSLQLLELGDELAHTLSGQRGGNRVPLVIVAVGLAAMATAAAGPIGFVALVAPQIVRRLLKERSPGLVPAAAAGAALVVSADLAARTLFPAELPVGVVTAIIGAPVLVYLLARATRIGHAG
ncbi:iron chelate uptake ABC transporter family permease subunit [Hoyosella sp. YIM 151337]|uniref:FecCD family ABC transporter permease n=1 Tax=Hoyosella sp. YIM 151337 TaxID=2992742 RepID=UPI002235A4FD|nr:iron chelate uptake ABC transporter family permease subunit [Hoyosella sp. YIM 151337]MCW4353553.1 iron chelate uptake ABC transporter family permease subunit [Hoyosella sp. YIM 151337]